MNSIHISVTNEFFSSATESARLIDPRKVNEQCLPDKSGHLDRERWRPFISTISLPFHPLATYFLSFSSRICLWSFVSPFLLLLPYLSHFFAVTAPLAVHFAICMHYERLSHSSGHISRPLSHENVCATSTGLRYRFPMLAQRHALSRLMDLE